MSGKTGSNRTQLVIIFLTIFIDLLGFGIIIPVFPIYVQGFVTGTQDIGKIVALMVTAYALMQFIFSPIWGRLSDRIGRRPVILGSLCATGITHLLFALAPNLGLLFVARILTGIAAATIPTAMAFISDITSEKDRAKGMGLIGAAFGLGLILGPAMGGILSHLGGMKVALLSTALFSFSAFLLAFFKLIESVDVAGASERDYRRYNIWYVLKTVAHPRLGLLFIIFLLVSISFANFTTIFVLFTERRFGYSPTENGYLLALMGVVSASIQGRWIGPITEKFGEKKLITFATLLLSSAFLISRYLLMPAFLLVIVMIGTGIALHNTSIISLISKNAGADEQGGILGIHQSFSALGRMIGPIWGGYFFDNFGIFSPLTSAAVVILVSCGLSLALYRKDILS